MKLESVLEGFDYRVECDDFLLYELGRLIEDDRASFEDEEFREVIDDGIHEHIDTHLERRADMAMRLRTALPDLDEKARPAAIRVLRAIEDMEFPLHDVALVLQTYTNYLFQKLEDCAGKGTSREAEVADALFESLDDRTAVETALNTLGSIRSAVSARILAHLISEPMIEEDLEMKAYGLVRSMWPLPRHYILYSLKAHNHEDIPFRWFQLLIESNEPDAVERILEEVRAHADDPTLREDLLALIELLSKSPDPAAEEKIMQVLNDPQTPPAAARMLEQFLKTSAWPQSSKPDAAVWELHARLQSANKKYQAVAKLLDSGRKADAVHKLDELLKEAPGYPLAVMLKRLT